jgi:hypothetical protein
MMREPFELNFDYNSPATCEEEDQKVGAKQNGGRLSLAADDAEKKKKKKKILLNLDYEAVITAWASQGSQWAFGDRPNFTTDEMSQARLPGTFSLHAYTHIFIYS